MITTTAEKTMRMFCVQKAQQMWTEFSDNEKRGVRFGLFPGQKMQEADKEGYDIRMLSIALMDVASANGGMIA